MIISTLNSWYNEIIGDEHKDGFNNPLTALMAHREGEEHVSLFINEDDDDDDDNESDFEDYLEDDDDDDPENVQYHATPEEARNAFVKLCTDFVEARVGRPITYDSDLLANVIVIDDEEKAILSIDHPIVNMLMQDSDMHPDDNGEYDPIDEIGSMYVYTLETIKVAIISITEMFAESGVELEKTWIISHPERNEEVERDEKDINVIVL